MILVAIGANLPGSGGEPPIETCRRCLVEIGRLPGLRVVAVSSWHRTAPVPASDQPDYVNGVVRLAGMVDPAALLKGLQAIEQTCGRVRGVRNAARTLDLDIIDMAGLVRDAPDPILPHPRAHERAFVLRPLREVAPDWVEPRLRQTVEALLERLGEQALSEERPEGGAG